MMEIDFLNEASKLEIVGEDSDFIRIAEWGRSVAERAWRKGWDDGVQDIVRGDRVPKANPYAKSDREAGDK